MTYLNEIYKCETCGNMVEIVHAGKGELVCCGSPMKLMTENEMDAAEEKHVPSVESFGGKVKVNVGSVAHPMEEKHYIEWIEIICDGCSCKEFLKPGQVAEAVFNCDCKDFTVRAYCNLHGLWKA
jgi:superoxide reductase